MDTGTIAAFALVTGLTSLTPGPQMLFVLTQTAWRGARSGVAALAGLQLGNASWFVMAGLGLGTLARAAPAAFTGLALAGALYLGWLGAMALRHAGKGAPDASRAKPLNSHHALRDSLVVALSNPKSLVYVLALLPPFVDKAEPVAPQIALLAAVAISIDFALGLAYIAAGSTLSAAMQRHGVRLWLDRGVGTIFLLIAAAVIFASTLA